MSDHNYPGYNFSQGAEISGLLVFMGKRDRFGLPLIITQFPASGPGGFHAATQQGQPLQEHR